MSVSEPTPISGFPSLLVVFRELTGKELAGDETAEERRDFCLAHDDKKKPSCDYNTTKNVWHCHTCGEHGGVLDLVIASQGVDRRGAIKWLRGHNLLAESATSGKWESVDVLYQYTNADGVLLYEVGRWNNPKEFRQRRPRPDGKEGWLANLKGVERVPYRLPQLLAAAQRGDTIYVVEGEKDAERLNALGRFATTSAQGANWTWPLAWCDYFTGAARVVVLGDNDDAGHNAARHRGSVIARTVPDARVVVALPGTAEHGDVSDWLDAGHTLAELDELVAQTPTVEPYEIGFPEHAVAPLVMDMTDTGAAEWMNACVGDDMLWLPDYNAWYGWDGTRWTPRIVTQKFARIAVDQMRLAAQNYTGQGSDDFREFANDCRSSSRMKSILDCLKGIRFAFADRLDSHRMLLNVQNGVLDCVAGLLLPHDRELFMTKLARVEYDPDATCPNFEAWIAEVMENDAERIDYIQQIMGGSLVGKPGMRRMFFAYGPPGTGKSTITHIMREILGDYACSIDFNVVAAKPIQSSSGPSPELARLKGIRLICAVESRDNDKLDAAKLKQFVGGDIITARNLNQGMIEFPIEGTLFFSGNSCPQVEADESLWSKFKLIPFDHIIEKQDLEFFNKMLRPELPGILAWAIRGLQKLAANEWQLKDPASVVEATAQYRDSENRLLGFVEACCEMFIASKGHNINDFKAEPADLRAAYYLWTEQEHIRNALGDRSFSNQLKRMGLRNTNTNGKRVWLGIRLNQVWQNRLSQPGGASAQHRASAPEEISDY